MLPPEGSNEIMTHLTTGAGIVYGIEALKRIPGLRRISPSTTILNRVVSAVGAAIVALGIQATGDMQAGWTIHIPAGAVLLGSLWEWAKQFILQQLLYDGVVQKAGMPAAPPAAPSISNHPQP